MQDMKMRLFTQDELRAIIDQSYRILEEIGVDVHSHKALSYYREAGCDVDGNRVRMPRALVEKAVETAPSSFIQYDRNGNEAFVLGNGEAHFGPGPTCPNFMDARTGERRPSRKEDAATTALVCDALPNIDFAMSLCMIGDKTPELADVHEVDAMVRNTTKPLSLWAFNAENCQTIIDICAAAVGGLENLQKKPFITVYCEPTTPLLQTKEAIEILMLLAENRIPIVFSPGMITGATAPITLPGALSLAVAESLAGVVLSQHICPGVPIIGSTNGGPMDMKTMQHSYGAPELLRMLAGSCELFHELGLPLYGTAGTTDSKVVDAQAGAEAMAQIMLAVAEGGDLVHDVGFTDLAMTGSPLYLTVCDDIIGYVRRFFSPVIIDKDQMAFDAIEEVGPAGNYIDTDHTAEHFRDEQWRPALFDRYPYARWHEVGGKDMAQMAQERLTRILDDHKPEPLPDDVLAQIDALVADAEKRCVSGFSR